MLQLNTGYSVPSRLITLLLLVGLMAGCSDETSKKETLVSDAKVSTTKISKAKVVENNVAKNKTAAVSQVALARPGSMFGAVAVVSAVAVEASEDKKLTSITVYKSPTCGCCSLWIDHLEKFGFVADAKNTQNLSTIKSKYLIPANHQSCHTGVVNDYVFEGHVPAPIMQKFLDENPTDAIGLTVPGMPAGSPGMDMSGRYAAYDVFVMKKGGKVEVYQHVTAEQSKTKKYY